MLIKSLKSIQKRSGLLELTNAVAFILAIVFSILTKFPGAAWLLVVIGLSDIARFILCGTWYHIPFHQDVYDWHCPQKDDAYTYGVRIKICSYLVAAVMFAISSPTIELLAWYVAVSVSLFELIRTIAHVLYKHRANWLDDNNGEMGYISYGLIVCIIEIVISIHLITTNYLGKASLIIACILASHCIVTMDFINPYTVRKGLTRFYGWLEAFTQKFFYLGYATAIIIALAKTGFKLNGNPIAIIIAVLAFIAALRDIVMAIWHLMGRWSINYITERNHSYNLLRRVAIYVWIILSLIALIMSSEGFACATIVFMLITIVLSIVCILSDEADIEYSLNDYRLYEEEPY